MKFYLRLEAVNLVSFVSDTDDLSTVRGGGLLLRRAPREVRERWPGLVPVAMGASTGIFEFEAASDDRAQVVRCEVEAFLRSHTEFRHATFVVDVCAGGDRDKFDQDRERLLAFNRWRQWRQPTIAVPRQVHALSAACEVDKVRPATRKRQGPAETVQAVSESVLVRSDFGRSQKRQDFYKDEAGSTVEHQFARDFEELATGAPLAFGVLDGKIGVIYLDGNKFGDKQNRHCTSVDGQRRFDETVRTFRKEFLRALLDEAQDASNRARWLSTDQRVRLEVLLWGGDELLIVVPAWNAWSTLRLFYERSRALTFAGERLTHKGGLVFCHHNAPIQPIRVLAERLARRAKGDGTGNAFAYVVLESFDHAGLDLDGYFTNRYGGADMTLAERDSGSLAQMMEIAERELPRLRQAIPRRQLHRVAAAVAGGQAGVNEDIGSLTTAVEATGASLAKAEKAFGPSTPDAGGRAPFWLHMLELWDYVAPGR